MPSVFQAGLQDGTVPGKWPSHSLDARSCTANSRRAPKHRYLGKISFFKREKDNVLTTKLAD
jgi:hypothetical protein